MKTNISKDSKEIVSKTPEKKEEKKEEKRDEESEKEELVINIEDKEDKEDEFYKEICLSLKESPESNLVKYSSIFNYKNYFILLNKTNSNTDDINQMITCEICQTKKSGDFLICDICFNAAHEKCLTVKDTKNEWICERCKTLLEKGNENKIICKFCNREKGLLILDNSEWYHCKCLNLNNKKMSFKFRFCPNKCSFCNRNADNLILCQKKGCSTYFHQKCALKESNQFDYCKFHINEIEKLLTKKTQRNNS